MDNSMTMLAYLVDTTGSMAASFTAMDSQHQETHVHTQQAEWLDPEEFADVLAERRSAGIQDFRVRHKERTLGYTWSVRYGRLVPNRDKGLPVGS